MKIRKERLLKEVEEKVGKEIREVLQEAWEQFESSGYGIKGDLLHLYDVVEQVLDHYQEVEVDPPAELVVALGLHDCDRFYPSAPKLEDFPNHNPYKEGHAWFSTQRAREILLESQLEPDLISRILARILIHHANWEHDQWQEVFSTLDERSFWRVYLKTYLERIGKDRTPEEVKDKMHSKYVDLSDEDKERVKNQVERVDNPTLRRLFADLIREFPD
jgi:hypothetical protein